MRVSYRGRPVDVCLDAQVTDLPPRMDLRLAKPPALARIRRVPGGHQLSALAGVPVKVEGRPIGRIHSLRGGEEIEVDGFVGVYTAAEEELPWPLVIVLWPPDGPPLEVRTHRARVAIGMVEGDILIDDDTVDDLHCTITRYRNGLMQVEDHRSYNGVLVDGRRIQDVSGLRDGAELHLGATRARVWVDPPDVGDLRTKPPQDAHGGLPSDGFDPAESQDLTPYAVELGPDYVQTRRRTFDDEVPTRLEDLGERVDVRPTRREVVGEDDRNASGEYRLPSEDERPSWAPVEARRDRKVSGNWRRRSAEGGMTLVHDVGGGDKKKPRR